MKLNKIISRAVILSIIGLFLPLSAGCRAAHFKHINDLKVIGEKSFSIKPGKNLRIKTSTGDVIVTSWDKEEVYIKISGDDDAEENMRFEFENDGNLVELTAKKQNSFTSWFEGLNLKIEVKVPHHFNIDVNTAGGDIKYGGINGKVFIQTSGGDIWGEKFTGRLEAATSGGDISLIGYNSKIDASTSGGDIKLDYSGENFGIELSTSGGDILVKLPEDFNASATLRTSGGDVYCGLPMKNISKSSNYSIVGDINDGGELLIAETSGGDVDVIKK